MRTTKQTFAISLFIWNKKIHIDSLEIYIYKKVLSLWSETIEIITKLTFTWNTKGERDYVSSGSKYCHLSWHILQSMYELISTIKPTKDNSTYIFHGQYLGRIWVQSTHLAKAGVGKLIAWSTIVHNGTILIRVYLLTHCLTNFYNETDQLNLYL